MKINQVVTESQMTCSECGGPAFSDLILAEKQDACYNKVRSRYKVWPSAYASGALVQCRKKGAANWGNKTKNEGLGGDLNEFAPPGSGDDDGGFDENTLKRLAAQWWHGDEDPGVEKTLAAAGWEIGQDEGYDNGGVFVVRAGDENGDTYTSWAAEELEGLSESYPKHQDLSGISTDKLKAYLAKQAKQSVPGEGAQVKRVKAELQRREQGVSEDSPRQLPKRYQNAIDDFDRFMDDPESTYKGDLQSRHDQTKKRIKTKPMAGPKGVLPEQGVAEAAKWRDPKYKDKLYTQEPGDSDDYDNIGYGYDFPERPENDPGQKRRMGGVGSEFDHNDPLKKGQGIGRSGIKHSLNLAGKRKGLPSRDQITSLKGSIKDAHGKHVNPDLPESDVAEGMMGNPDQPDSPVAQAIIRRILMQRTDLLAKYGPGYVGQAVDDVADSVGDWDEIGSSDVSGWVRQVEHNLKNKLNQYDEPMDEDYNPEYDDEAGMADNNLETLQRAVEGIDDLIQSGDNLPEWCQEKIAVAKSMLVAVWDYMYSEEASDEVDPEIDAMYEAMDQLAEEIAAREKISADLVWESFEALDDHMLYETAAWRRKEGKSKSGGLNRKGVASYRRENPGSKLQMAVTTKPSKLKPGSKAAKRRKSFCARMSGVKGPMKKPNGKPTRKALALRKWNC